MFLRQEFMVEILQKLGVVAAAAAEVNDANRWAMADSFGLSSESL